MARKDLRADIGGQAEEYRKGMVLGFTMAEIMLVLLFLLLLLLGKLLQDLREQLGNSAPLNSPEVVAGQGLQDRFNSAKENKSIPSNMTFEKWVGKLIFQSEADETDILEAEIKRLELLLEEKENKIQQLQRDLGPLAEMRETIFNLEKKLADYQQQVLALAAENEALELEIDALKRFRDKYDGVASAFDKSGISPQEGAQCLLDCGEQGFPACWGESINNPDFIYDIAMFDDHFWVALREDNKERNLVKWNALPDKARISTPMFLGRGDFRDHMQGLNEYSKAHENCKFSVRLFDVQSVDAPKETYVDMVKEVKSVAYPAERPKQNWSNGPLPCDSCAPKN